jgi:hypothetical protein
MGGSCQDRAGTHARMPRDYIPDPTERQVTTTGRETQVFNGPGPSDPRGRHLARLCWEPGPPGRRPTLGALLGAPDHRPRKKRHRRWPRYSARLHSAVEPGALPKQPSTAACVTAREPVLHQGHNPGTRHGPRRIHVRACRVLMGRRSRCPAGRLRPGAAALRTPRSTASRDPYLRPRRQRSGDRGPLGDRAGPPAHDGEPRVPAESRSHGLAVGANRADLPSACDHPVISGSSYPVAALTDGFAGSVRQPRAVHAPSEPSGSQRSPAVHRWPR